MLLIGFFSYIKYIITGNSTELEKIRQLNRMFKVFKSAKYRYITKEKVITPLFVNKIWNIYTHTLSFKSALESTIFNSDEKRSQLFLNYLIELNIPKEIASKKDKFTKEGIWQKIMEGDSPNKVIKGIESEFNMYRNYFTKYNMPKFESEYQLLYKLYNLSTFNFEMFFSKFDNDFNKTSSVPPNYSPVNGVELLNDLKDLYFLFASLPQKIDASNLLGGLFQRISEIDHKNLTKIAINSINTIYKMIGDELSSEKMMFLCRFISEDIRLKINVEFKNVSIIEKFRKELDERFNKTKDIVLEKYSEQSLTQEISSLFKNQELLKIKGYTEEISQLIDNNNYKPIAGLQAFRITKTFLLNFYETNIKEVVNTLILEGFFTEKEYQSDFSNIFFLTNELKQQFIDQEETIAINGNYSFKTLQTFLTKSVSNDPKVIKIIEVINERIYATNKRTGELLYKFGNKLYDILKDYKSPKPEKITNIKTLKGLQNKEFIGQLVSAYNDIAKYIKIIKTFVAFDTAEKKR